MKKKRKTSGRPLTHALLLFVVTFAVTIPARAYTDGQIVTFGQHTYQVINSTTSFTLRFLGTTASGHLNVPATVDDGNDIRFTVVEVGGDEAYRCNNVTSVTLPETVTRINSASFNGSKLTSMHIPKSVTSISHGCGYQWNQAPQYTVDPDNDYFTADSDGTLYSKDMTELYSVPSVVGSDNSTYTINESVTKVWADAFLRNSNLKKVIFPKNLEQIDTGFPTITYGCTNIEAFEVAPGGTTTFHAIDGVLFDGNKLMDYPQGKKDETYKVPDGITQIVTYGITSLYYMKSVDLNDVTNMEAASLNNLSQLATVVLPKNLVADANVEGAITSCKRISSYVVPDDCVNFKGEDGVVYSKDMKTLYFYPPNKAGETFDIPLGVEKIARYAFRDNLWLTSLDIPANVSEIGPQAFREMQRLQTVSFAEPSSVETFGAAAFMQCQLLTEVTLPTSLTKVSGDFYRCDALEVINVPDGSKLNNIDGSSFISNKALKEFNFLGTCELKTIGSNAFANLTKLQSFDVPKGVTDISTNAFSGCSSLATVTFDEDAAIRYLRTGAFADCGLTSVTIPESVVELGREVFRHCEALTDVNLSAKIANISPEAFKHCWNLDNITVDKDNTVYSSIDGYLLTVDKETLVIFPPGKANSKFTLLPPSITKIGDYAFYDCSKLENVIIPNKVNTIGKRAFGLCTNLNTITFLSDEVIDPANIDQGANTMSFDDGGNVAANMFPKIDTYVRRHLQADFQRLPFYQKFRIVGTSFIQDGNEYLPVSDNSVDLLAVGNRDWTFVVPTKTTDDNPANTEYSVALIGDYAFQNTTADVHEVVVKNNVEYIGAQAFVTDIGTNESTVERVFLIGTEPTKRMLSTTRFELDETGNDYSEFARSTNVYVKKSYVDDYKSAWTKTVYDKLTKAYGPSPYNFTSQIDYRIPGVGTSTRYATFSREFDTDFSDYFATNGNTEVAAFVAAETGIVEGIGDFGTTEWHVSMTSIDENGGNSSYAYVPANTGVLLKVLDNVATAADFYYTIGEQDDQAYAISNNIMTGVNVNPATNVAATESEPVYVIQNGVFCPVTSTLAAFPIHKAYMKIGPMPAGAKVVIDFGDGATTGVGKVEAADEGLRSGSDAVYDLSGRRVGSNARKGIYIYKGKKIVIK